MFKRYRVVFTQVEISPSEILKWLSKSKDMVKRHRNLTTCSISHNAHSHQLHQLLISSFSVLCRQTDRQTDRQMARHTDRWSDIQKVNNTCFMQHSTDNLMAVKQHKTTANVMVTLRKWNCYLEMAYSLRPLWRLTALKVPIQPLSRRSRPTFHVTNNGLQITAQTSVHTINGTHYLCQTKHHEKCSYASHGTTVISVMDQCPKWASTDYWL